MFSKLLALAAVFSTPSAAAEYDAVGDPEGAGKKFLEDKAKEKDVIALPSGLMYKVLEKGSGKVHPLPHTTCDCHYKGTLVNGDQFDSSYDRGQPTSFAPNQVIKGWTEAMQLMVKGDKWEMYIPYELAYGESGSPPKIPGKSTLVFTMEIVDVKGEGKPAVTCNPATKEECSDKEKTYIDKMNKKDAAGRKTELKRLEDMSEKNKTARNMTRKQRTWLDARLQLLKKMTAEEKSDL